MEDTSASQQKNRNFESAFSLFEKSKDLVVKNAKLFAILYSLPLLLELLNIVGSSKDPAKTEETFTSAASGLSTGGLVAILGTSVLVLLIITLVGILLQVMMYAAELHVSDGKKPTIGEVFNVAKKYFWRIIGFSIVFGLLLIGGFLLLIVPGLIVLRRYFLTPYYIIDKDLSIGEAMKQSAADTKPVSGAIWGVIGVFVLIALTAIVPVIGGLISLVLTTLYSIAPALRYRQITGSTRSVMNEQNPAAPNLNPPSQVPQV